jgi:hypothetical protein
MQVDGITEEFLAEKAREYLAAEKMFYDESRALLSSRETRNPKKALLQLVMFIIITEVVFTHFNHFTRRREISLRLL